MGLTFVRWSFCVFVFLYVCVCVCISVYMPVCLSVYLSAVLLSIDLSLPGLLSKLVLSRLVLLWYHGIARATLGLDGDDIAAGRYS